MPVSDDLAPAYEAVTSAAGQIDRSATGKLLLTGDEAAAFLDGQVTNDIGALEPGTGCYAAFLTPKGKMLGDLRVLRTTADEPTLLLLCERVALQGLFDQVRRGLIGWRAELHKRTLELGMTSLVGPGTDAVLADAGLPVPPAAEHASATAGEVVVVRTDVGADVLAPADAMPALGAPAVSEAVAEVVRVEHGRPRYGIDLDEGVMPAEAGLEDRAVSFTKGCYIGQEPVARLHWKGRPNRHLRGLRLAAPVATGAVLSDGDREVGRVGSAVESPRLGPIALAIVRREVEPGAHVTVGQGVDAEVVALPFAAAT